ncbi:MAG: hypothetical protein FWE63_05470 [Bacteroidales bacterium]|nr:hypothetical protein [Bacteroidales bacterium]
MKNFKEFGTLLTREESKEIRGGYLFFSVVGGKEDGGGDSAGCSEATGTYPGMTCKADPCERYSGGELKGGTCGYSHLTKGCFCYT